MELKNTWKTFAIRQFYSHYPSQINAVSLYEALVDSGEDVDLHAIEASHSATRWLPFDNMLPNDFIDAVVCCAQCAQETEEENQKELITS